MTTGLWAPKTKIRGTKINLDMAIIIFCAAILRSYLRYKTDSLCMLVWLTVVKNTQCMKTLLQFFLDSMQAVFKKLAHSH